jgi:NAD(P)-dependent dehydrogenase (short-subunit alcohol dehydrogenase family)
MHAAKRRLAHYARCLAGPRLGAAAQVALQHTGAAPEEPDARKPVCLVLGAGAGIGQAVARKFATEGFHACMVRRGSGPNRLLKGDGNMEDGVVASIRESGGSASVFFADATVPAELASLVQRIEAEVGPIGVAVYNVGAQFGNRSLEKTSYRIFELGFSMGSLGAFAMAKEVAPAMLRRGQGTLLFTGATAGYRGNPFQHAHTAAMGARRNLCQSLNAELGPQGIHVCHVNVDGMVDAPETLGAMAPGLYEKMQAEMVPNDEVLLPASIADTYWHVHSQPRNCWTFDLDVRPWKTMPWFNTANNNNLKI